jgi:hypothetical protein
MRALAHQPRHELGYTLVGNPTKQAYELLHWTFVAVPAVAGLDKFTHVLADWDLYLAPGIPHAFGTVAQPFMVGVGLIEVGMALLVALRPRSGATVIALWLGAIVINLLMLGSHYDVALGDFGLILASFALERLARAHEKGDITF